MAVATATLHRLPPGSDPVPRRPRREQRPGVVPAAQGRVRAAPEGSRWRSSASPSRRSSARRDIPLHADPARSPFRIYRDTRFSKDKSPYKTARRRELRLGRRRRRRGRRAARTPRTSTRAAATSTSSRARSTSAAASGIRRPSWLEGVPASGSPNDPTGFRGDRRGAGVRGDVRRRSATTASRSSGSRPATRRTIRPRTCSGKKNVTFGRRLADDEAISPALPDSDRGYLRGRDAADALPRLAR